MSKTKSSSGRKLFDGKDENLVLQKLEEAFALGASDEEACLYANISPSALYAYQKGKEGFLERKQLLKLNPVLKARQTVVKALENNPDLAFKYLERRKREEFGSGAKIQISHSEVGITEEDKARLDDILQINMSATS